MQRNTSLKCLYQNLITLKRRPLCILNSINSMEALTFMMKSSPSLNKLKNYFPKHRHMAIKVFKGKVSRKVCKRKEIPFNLN